MDVTIACVCPGTPHDSDTVTLRDRLDFRQAASLKGDIVLMKLDNPTASNGETLAVLSEGYLRHGIASWSLVDEQRKPLEVNWPAIEEHILGRLDVAFVLADAADDLYAEAVMRPLLGLGSPSSPPTPTADSTSPDPSPSETASRSTSPTPLPKRSKQSSTSTSPTDGIATTTASRDGDSSSSQSSTSAA